MKLLDDDLFLDDVDDTKASDGSGEGYEDLLKSLEKKAAEIESETHNSN